MTESEGQIDLTELFKEYERQDRHRERFAKALQTGDIETIRDYTQDCSRINFQLIDMPPLHHAVLHGQFDVVKYLVQECGADVNTPGTDATFPALHAAIWGRKNTPDRDLIIDFLITEGADLNYADPWYSRSVVYLALEEQKYAETPDYSLTFKLIKHGADPCIARSDFEGYEPPHYPVDLIPNTEENTQLRAIFEQNITDEERLERITEYQDTQRQQHRNAQHHNIQRKQQLMRACKRK